MGEGQPGRTEFLKSCAPVYPQCSKSLNSGALPVQQCLTYVLHMFGLLMMASTCEVGHTVLNILLVFFILTYLILTTTFRGMYCIAPILWSKKLRLREVKLFIRDPQ